MPNQHPPDQVQGARQCPSTLPALVGLCAVVLAFYARLWLPDLILIKRDAFRFFLPLKSYMVERLSHGELPQWFPYEALGRPFLGIPVTGVFHPFTALYLALPVHEAYRLATLVTCLLAALGAFALGRTLGFSRVGALAAGVAFALSGYVVSLTENLVYLYSVCLLPLFCVALEKSLTKGFGWIAAAAVLWATVFLNGDVQTGYYYGFIALAWALCRGQGAYGTALARLGMTALVAGLLAGIQLGPALAVYLTSERTHPELFHEQALSWSTHPLRLLTVVASPVGGQADPVEVAHRFFGSRPAGAFPIEYWAESLYLGVPVMGLAFLGARHCRGVRVLALLGGSALVLALGRYGGLYEAFYHLVPLWSAFRYPERLMGVVSFSMAMLAGAGMDAVREGKGRLRPWIVVAVLCAMAGFGLRTDAAGLWTTAHFGAPMAVAREVASSAGLAFLVSAGAAILVGSILAGLRTRRLKPEALLFCLVGIIGMDLSRANLEACHTGPVEAATFTPGLVEAVQQHSGVAGPGHFRVNAFEELEFVSREPIDRWLSPLGITSVMLRQALDLEHNAQFHIESGKTYLPGFSAAFLSLGDKKLGINAAARFNVAYFTGRTVHFQKPWFADSLIAVVGDYDLALVKNPVPVKPRAYLSSRPERADAPVELAALLARSDFLNGEADVVEAPQGSLPGPARGGTVAVQTYEPERVQVRVETPEPAVLILVDAFDAGWRAELESGEEIPILRANALVRAVVVHAGDHLVTFTYQTPYLKEGAGASLAGGLFCLGLVLRSGRVIRAGRVGP